MRRIAIVALLGAVLAGCAPEDQETSTVDPQEVRRERSPELLAALDSGSAAYRADDFRTALEQYTRATELAPNDAAGWFGIYMAQRALGNEAAADEAMERARGAAPGATLIHPTAEDTLGDGGEEGT